jgi:hypothetical protein
VTATNLFSCLIIIAMLAAAGALGLGIAGMFIQGPFYQNNKNRLMQLRVLFQGVAILLIALIFMLK